MKDFNRSDFILAAMIGVLLAVMGMSAGVNVAEKGHALDCEKLGRVVLDDRVFECREVTT